MAYTNETPEIVDNAALDLAAKIGAKATVVIMVSDDRRYYVKGVGSSFAIAGLARVGTKLMETRVEGTKLGE